MFSLDQANLEEAESCVHNFAAGLAHDFFEQNFTQIADVISNWGDDADDYVEQMCLQTPDDIRGYLRQINAVSVAITVTDPGFFGIW